MKNLKHRTGFLTVLILLISSCALAQQPDSLNSYRRVENNLKPHVSYSLGSSFMVIPKLGSITGVTLSPFLSVPISPRLSVDAGFVAGRYYSTLPLFNQDGHGQSIGAFNQISIYGSATYRINPQLTIYGTGMKTITNSSPYSFIPKSSYTIGTSYNFGSFSIGASMQVNKYDNALGDPWLMGK